MLEINDHDTELRDPLCLITGFHSRRWLRMKSQGHCDALRTIMSLLVLPSSERPGWVAPDGGYGARRPPDTDLTAL